MRRGGANVETRQKQTAGTNKKQVVYYVYYLYLFYQCSRRNKLQELIRNRYLKIKKNPDILVYNKKLVKNKFE